MPTPDFNFLIYKTAEEDITVNAVIRDETIWLTQKAMSELFGVQTPAISKHLKSIFEEGELAQEVVVSKMEIPTPHGAMPGKTQMQTVMMYNLDAIISVGYRINSHRATQYLGIPKSQLMCKKKTHLCDWCADRIHGQGLCDG